MAEVTTADQVLELLKQVEHPEIAVNLVDLGMIMDVGIEGNLVTVALALPMLGIPEAVRAAIVQVIQQALAAKGLELKVHYFEMDPETRDRFFAAARANWKGSI